MSNKALIVKSLEKAYGINKDPAIKDISFEVSDGAFHTLIGHNGSGKTTTLKSLVGGFKRVEGTIKIFGLELNNKTRKMLGYIPEVAKFPKDISTLDYLTYTYYVSEQVKLSKAKSIAKDAIKKYDLTEFEKTNPNELSSGQKKKVLLTQALMTNPKLLIMDEPTANFDPIARQDFWQYIKRINKEGITIIVATHIISEVEDIASEVTVIDRGEIKFNGSKPTDKKIIDLYKEHITRSIGGYDV